MLLENSMQFIRLFTVLVVLNLVACQSKPKQEASSQKTEAQPDSAAQLAKRPGPDSPRSAADRLVRALYFEHNKKDNPFREKDPALVEQFYEKSLAGQISSALAAGKLKAGAVNPLFNAPDDAVKKAWVDPAAVGGTRAIVYVTFENKGKSEEIKIDLQQFAGRWRIIEMTYPEGKKLTDMVK